MAKIEFDDFERYEKMLKNFADSGVEAEAKIAVYHGAGTAVKAIQEAIEKHPTSNNPTQGMTEQEKKGLLKGLGISPMEAINGDINAKIGFDGYDTSRKTKRWPKGVPYSVTARSLRKGTSWRKKADFIGPAISKSKKNINQAMEEALDEAIKKKMEK